MPHSLYGYQSHAVLLALACLTVIAVYAPTLDAEEEAKGSVYDDLQDAVDNVPSGDMLNAAGNWNARPGPVHMATWNILDKFALNPRCANSNRLVDSRTRFHHPRRHLIKWSSNDGSTRNQIDHMLVRSHWAFSVTDCRAYDGAQTSRECGSDHLMIRVQQRLHIKAAYLSNSTRRS